MKVKESIEQLNSLITHFNNGGLDFNATDIEAIKCLLNKRQKLIDYLKEQIDLQTEITKNSKSFRSTKYQIAISLRLLCQEILSKIEKE